MQGGGNDGVRRYDPEVHHRRSVRLKGYDYSATGAYFITICVHHHQCLLGRVGATSRSPVRESNPCSSGQVIGATNGSPLQETQQSIDVSAGQPGMILNEYGLIVHDEWMKTAQIRPGIELGTFVIMPNHLHGIIIITSRACRDAEGDRQVARTGGQSMFIRADRRGDQQVARTISDSGAGIHAAKERMDYAIGPKRNSIGAVIAGFKSAATKRINELRQTPGVPVWQRNYYEHIIHGDRPLRKIRKYIADNPMAWQMDQLHPQFCGVRMDEMAVIENTDTEV